MSSVEAIWNDWMVPLRSSSSRNGLLLLAHSTSGSPSPAALCWLFAAMSGRCPIDIAAADRDGRPVRSSAGARAWRRSADEALPAHTYHITHRIEQVAVDAVICDDRLLLNRWNGRPSLRHHVLIGWRALSARHTGHHHQGGDEQSCSRSAHSIIPHGRRLNLETGGRLRYPCLDVVRSELVAGQAQWRFSTRPRP